MNISALFSIATGTCTLSCYNYIQLNVKQTLHSSQSLKGQGAEQDLNCIGIESILNTAIFSHVKTIGLNNVIDPQR